MKITETNAQLISTIASRTLKTSKENQNKNAKRKNSSKIQNVLNLHKSQSPKMRPLSHKTKITETNAQLRSTIASRRLETPKENSNKNAKRKNSSKMQNVLNLHKSQTPKMRPLSHK